MLKNIIFDLDGTLWQTRDSYVAAYHRLCAYYQVPQIVSDQDIVACLGVKLDRFLPRLFPMVEDQRALAYRAMGFSIDYLMEHPADCCYQGVGQLLEEISRQYDVYIVSNCMDAYVETFLQLAGAKQFVKAFYTIESGEKEDHIAHIAATGKSLLVRTITGRSRTITGSCSAMLLMAISRAPITITESTNPWTCRKFWSVLL